MKNTTGYYTAPIRIKETWQYKGFIVNFINNEWRAEAYSNPSFYCTTKADIKKQINKYLNN